MNYFYLMFLITLCSLEVYAKSLIGVDIRDLRDYGPHRGEYDRLIDALEWCEDCFPEDIQFMPYGATQDVEFTQRNVALSGYQYQEPTFSADGSGEFHLQFLVLSANQIFIWRLNIAVTDTDHRVLKTQKMNFNDGRWSIKVHGIQRTVVVENAALGFKAKYPVNLGGFSSNYKSLKLPPHSTYILDSYRENGRYVESNNFSRTSPSYYQGYPFIRTLVGGNRYTLYGFHGPMQPGRLKRGFLSTGCLRLRVKDIYELFYIVKFIKNRYPINVTSIHEDGTEQYHPYPHYNEKHKVVNSRAGRGPDGLTQMKTVDEPPPIDFLRSHL